MFKPGNTRDWVISILRPSKTTTDRVTRYLCDGRAVLAGRQPLHATQVDARWRASLGNMNNLSSVRHDKFIL